MKQLTLDIQTCAKRIDELLNQLLPQEDTDARRVREAMRYSALSGGKRVRPYMTLKVAQALNGDMQTALYFGAALEMIHTYSLIHDDLPCMDDDDYRRGKRTCHKMFDEATALLAGDALLTHAFGVIADAPATDRQKVAAMRLLADMAGCRGMIGGQAMDLASEHRSIPFDTLRRLYSEKTGALMRAAVGLGCISADCYEGKVYDAFATYAEELGLTFQIVDDLLDVYGNESLGKPIGSDEKNGKNTYLSFMSREEAEAEAMARTEDAKAALREIPATEELCGLADLLLTRKK